MADWDPNYFKSKKEVVEILKGKHGEIESSDDMYSTLFVAFRENIAYRLFYFKDRVYRVIKYPENVKIKVPISLPTGVGNIILPVGRTIYRMCNDDETSKIGRPRFYAENSTFNFAGTASAQHRGELYEYKILTPIVIVNFDKQWRSRLWGGDSDNKGLMSYTEYEEVIQQVCEEAGAQGWRAACWPDQQYPQTLASAEFEIALFSSNLVKRGRKLYTDTTTLRF
ncbi:MAG: hypothetical protein CL967_05590 [Euryarchaeota archaeon]|nr:hypothetical protein [Euryarchaeota archaeon]